MPISHYSNAAKFTHCVAKTVVQTEITHSILKLAFLARSGL